MYTPLIVNTLKVEGIDIALNAMRNPYMSHSKASQEADYCLAAKLIKAGDEHGKAFRGIMVWFQLAMQVGFMLELDTYKIGIDTLSTSSTMQIDLRGMKGPELAAKKQELLPEIVYRRTAMASYQTLRRMYLQREHHRHPDWTILTNWVTTLPLFDKLILPD